MQKPYLLMKVQLPTTTPQATVYRLVKHLEEENYELSCDSSHEIFKVCPIDGLKVKKGQERPLAISFQGATYGSSTAAFAEMSAVQRKKINLKQKEPIVKLSSLHGDVSMLIYRGGYCGYQNPESTIEYYWQLRYHEKRLGTRGSAQFKDAVLRRALKGQLSTMSGMYIPNQPQSPPYTSDTGSVETRSTTPVENEVALGRLLLRADLDSFDRDVAITSFIAVFMRVIEVEVSSVRLVLHITLTKTGKGQVCDGLHQCSYCGRNMIAWLDD